MKKNIIFACCVSIACSLITATPVMADDYQSCTMASLGDSYSSGEGIEPFYGETDNHIGETDSEDWLAHRSTEAWSGKLVLPGNDGKTMSEVKDDGNWLFAATSGAETKHLKSGFKKEYNHVGQEGHKTLTSQLKSLKEWKKEVGHVDYVTMTMGGNDVGFTDVITQSVLYNIENSAVTTSMRFAVCNQPVLNLAILNNHFLDTTALTSYFNSVWDKFENEGIRDDISKAYGRINKSVDQDTRIIIAGYPELVSANGSILINSAEATLINDNVYKFNDALEKLVNEWHDDYGVSIYFVSVEHEFSGHGNGSNDSYINPISLVSKAEDLSSGISAYSLHPNEKGAQAYARCVQAKIDELESSGSTAESAASNSPSVTSGDSEDSSDPTSVVYTFFEAIQSGDMKAAINCFDPTTIKSLNLVSKYTGDQSDTIVESAMWEGLKASGLLDATLLSCSFDSNLSDIPILNRLFSTTVTLSLQYSKSNSTTSETLRVKYYSGKGWRIIPDSMLKTALFGGIGDVYE